MRKRSGLGMVALVAATSCVPPATAPRLAAAPAAAIADPAALLRRLALDPPMEPELRVPTAAIAVPTRAAPPFAAAARSDDDARRALECLTSAVYHEARSESGDGQRAVAQVVLNRVRDRAFPASVCGVVYQGSQRRTGCQFSFTCDGSLLRPRDPAAWDRARGIAEAALAGAVYAPVGGATFYHASSMLPWWAPSLTRVTAVGAHLFYRWRGAMERALAFRQHYAQVEPGAPATPAPPQPGTDGGVTRYALDDGAVVAVHRGPLAIDPPVRRTLVSAGVRVHLGRSPDLPGGPAMAAEIGEESGAI